MSGARWSLPSLLEAEESSSTPRRGPRVLVASGLTPSTLTADSPRLHDMPVPEG